MSKAIETLRSATEMMWTAAPKELDGLSTMHRPPSGDLPKRLYANFDAYWLAGVLYQLRELAADDTLESATLGKISGHMAGVAARRLRTWGFEGAATAVDAAAGELAGTRERIELRSILAELIVLIDRLHVWIDSTIPWADMDGIKPLPAPRVGS